MRYGASKTVFCSTECVCMCVRERVRVHEHKRVEDFVREMRGIYVRKNVCFLCPGCICECVSVCVSVCLRWRM